MIKGQNGRAILGQPRAMVGWSGRGGGASRKRVRGRRYGRSCPRANWGAATGDGPTHISRPCSAQRSRPSEGVTLDEYLASSGVAVPRPSDLVNSGTAPRRPPRSPPRTPSPPERKAQRRHSPIPADASAGQIRAYHRRQALSPARQRTVRTQSFRALPNCPYKASDRRKEHLRRIMLGA